MRRNPPTSALTTIIFPAMKSRGMHSNAVCPRSSPRKESVIRALFTILSFSTLIFLGLPVDPLVNTVSSGWPSCHILRKSSSVILSFSMAVEELVVNDVQGHFYIVGEELSGAESLRQGGRAAIDMRRKLGDGTETHIALQSAGHP